MSNPKVKVGADVSGVKDGVTAVTTAVIDANKKAQAEIEKTRRLSKKATEEQIENARKMRDAIVAAGGRGARALKSVDFDDLVHGGGSARNLSPFNPAEAERMRRRILEHLGLPVGGGGGGTGFGTFVGSSLQQAGRGVYHAVSPVGGVGGSILSNSVSAARDAGGLLSGAGASRLLAGGLIGAAAFGAVKLFGAAREKIGAAGDESSTTADTLRKLGGVASEFERLRDSARAASEGLGLTYNESARLAAIYAHEAALPASERGALGTETHTGAAFSRAYGLDPSAGVGFLAQMRHLGVTGGDRDNRRLAAQIGEVVASTGSTAKMGEVLQAIESFTQTVAARNMTAVGVGGMVGMTASMAGLGIKGFTADRAASLAGALDRGFASGAGGMAGDNLLLSTLQGLTGGDVSAEDLAAIKDAGYYGTVADVFGKQSQGYQLAKERGDQAEVDRRERILARTRGGTATIGDMTVGALGRNYGRDEGSTRALMSAMQTMFGLSSGQAATALRAVMAGGAAPRPDAEFKKPEKSVGDEIRDSSAKLDNTMQGLASRALPLLSGIREGVVKVAEFFGVMPKGALERMQADEARSELKARMDGKTSPAEALAVLEAEQARVAREGGPLKGDVGLDKMHFDAKLAASNYERRQALGSLAGGVTPFEDFFNASAQKYGVPVELLKAIAAKESGFNPRAVGKVNANGTQDFGLMQHNSRYLTERGLDMESVFDPQRSIDAAAKLLSQNYRRTGNWQRATVAYNGSGARAELYGADVYAAASGNAARAGRQLDAQVPADAAPASGTGGAGGAGRMEVDGRITLVDPRGSHLAIAQDLRVRHQGAPMPAGAR